VATLYEWAGGGAAFERLIDVFYDRVEHDELISDPGDIRSSGGHAMRRATEAAVSAYASSCEPRSARSANEAAMQQFAEKAARLFKLLAGQQRDERMSSYVLALYVYLFVIAMLLVFAWLGGMASG